MAKFYRGTQNSGVILDETEVVEYDRKASEAGAFTLTLFTVGVLSAITFGLVFESFVAAGIGLVIGVALSGLFPKIIMAIVGFLLVVFFVSLAFSWFASTPTVSKKHSVNAPAVKSTAHVPMFKKQTTAPSAQTQ